MKHIQQLASFKTGLDVRIGYPNEHLTDDTAKEMASPMYATGIGLVIEGIARAEYQERMERRKHKDVPFVKPVPVEPEEPAQPATEDGGSRKPTRREKKEKGEKRGFDITRIITKFFSEENEIKE